MRVSGTYFDGKLSLDLPVKTAIPVKVMVTFPSLNKKNRLKISDFTFLKTQELLKDYKGSFSDEVIEERRAE